MAAYPVDTAAISWVDATGATHIRVYWCDCYTVKDRCWDGNSWTDGSFSQQGGQVTATCWPLEGSVAIRVYCTFEDSITEWCSDAGGAWYQGGFTIS